MIRRRRAGALALALALVGCAGTPGPSVPLDLEDDGAPRIVVAVAGLDAGAVDAAIIAGGHRTPDLVLPRVFASGAGSAAAVTPFDRRPALDVLVDPRPLVVDGRPIGLRAVSASLRSSAGHASIFATAPVVDSGALSAVTFRDEDDVQFVLLDANVDVATVLDAIDAWRAALDDDPAVVLYGFPDRIDDPAHDLFVPVFAWASDGDGATRIDDATHDLTGLFVGAANDADLRWAAWVGGVYAEDGQISLRSTAEGFAFEGAASEDPRVRQALADRFAVELFGGTPRAWIAVRGSEAVDFVDLSMFGHMPLGPRLTPWALEDIDNVWAPNDNAVRYSLGAERQGDGAVLDLGWPPFRFEVRLTGTLKDALAEHGWLGTPIYTGAPTAVQGFGALVVEPWSRAFWTATRGSWPADAASWWPDAPAGVHLQIDGGADAPAPAPLD